MKRAIAIGCGSVRANRLPLAVLWALAAALVFGYWRVGPVSAVLHSLGEWQLAGGWAAAFASCAVFCGLLPGIFILSVPSLRVPRPFLSLGVQMLWSGLCGVVTNWMYVANAVLIGTGTDFTTLVLKIAVCQFVWTPLWFSPAGSLVYFWIGRDFSFSRCRHEWSWRLWLEMSVAGMLMSWALWIPCGLCVFMLPTELQVQVTGIVNAFNCLLLLVVGRTKGAER